MFSKNQVIVFVISFFITWVFLFAIPEQGFSGIACCINIDTSNQCPTPCFEVEAAAECAACGEGVSIESGRCEEIFACQEALQIPTVNQWGMFIMVGVIGLFAVIGLIIMRRRNALITNS